MMRAADHTRVPAGAALAVDRERFAELVTQSIETHPLIAVRRDEITAIPPASPAGPVILASGPLTSDALAEEIAALVGHRQLSFYDAISPIVLADSIDHGRVFRAFPVGKERRRARWRPRHRGRCEIDQARVEPTAAPVPNRLAAPMTATTSIAR